MRSGACISFGRNLRGARCVGLSAVCLLGSLLGCSNTDKSERSITADDLPGSGVAADGTGWQSAPFPTADDCAEDEARWLKLDRKTRSEGLIIAHELGRAPDVILPYVSTKASGCGARLGGADAVVIDHADEVNVKIHNNTADVLYVRLVLL